MVKRLSSPEPCIAPNFISSEFLVLLNNACRIVCKAACCLGKGLMVSSFALHAWPFYYMAVFVSGQNEANKTVLIGYPSS